MVGERGKEGRIKEVQEKEPKEQEGAEGKGAKCTEEGEGVKGRGTQEDIGRLESNGKSREKEGRN